MGALERRRALCHRFVTNHLRSSSRLAIIRGCGKLPLGSLPLSFVSSRRAWRAERVVMAAGGTAIAGLCGKWPCGRRPRMARGERAPTQTDNCGR